MHCDSNRHGAAMAWLCHSVFHGVLQEDRTLMQNPIRRVPPQRSNSMNPEPNELYYPLVN